MIDTSYLNGDRATGVHAVDAPFSQRNERTILADAIRQLITEFTAETGLVVEEIDIELDDSLFWWNPDAQARYQSVRIKAVLL